MAEKIVQTAGRAGCRRASDHACSSKEYVFPYEEYCTWKRKVRTA
nr:hypothetical protein [Butyrivibrio sp. AC2005]